MIFAAIVLSLVVTTALFLYTRLNKNYAILSLSRRIKTSDGSDVEKIAPTAKGKTIFGNTFDMISMDAEQLFNYSRSYAQELKCSYIQYVLGTPIYCIIDPVEAEFVLTEPTLITKGFTYNYLSPFLQTGLLISSDRKWHTRRRLLTPAFHFNILSQFLEIFKRESLNFIKNIDENCYDLLSLNDVIPRFTLNNICETALGVQLDEHMDGDEYRKNITKVEDSFLKRIMNPLLTWNWAYNWFSDGKKDEEYIKQLHDFSSEIIKKRRCLFEEEMSNDNNTRNADLVGEEENIGKKRRYAMLDTLLCAEKDGFIDHAGICEEVDTFMFEGFDTTSMNLIFTLMNLSLYPDMQQRCYEEINTYIDDDLNKLNIAQLSNLKYLDCFIKETQRLYPSVPLILRHCVQETLLPNKLILPKGTEIIIQIFDIQRNPKYYDEPEKFRPDRFFAENADNRHPFAFVPFSAGQRNCIGQKFAMLEMKTLLVYVLKNFKILPRTDPKSLRFLAGLLIRTKSQAYIKIVRR